jgi:hypothetical protein
MRERAGAISCPFAFRKGILISAMGSSQSSLSLRAIFFRRQQSTLLLDFLQRREPRRAKCKIPHFAHNAVI